MAQVWQLNEIESHRWSEEFSEYEFRVSWIDENRSWEPTYIKLHNFVSDEAKDTLNTYLLEQQLNPWKPPAEYGPLEAPEFIDGKRVRVSYGNDELGKQAARKALLEKTGGRSIQQILTHRFSEETQDVCYSVVTNPTNGAEVWIDSYLLEATHEYLLFDYIKNQLGNMVSLGIGNLEEDKVEKEERKDADKEAEAESGNAEVSFMGVIADSSKKNPPIRRSSATGSDHGNNRK